MYFVIFCYSLEILLYFVIVFVKCLGNKKQAAEGQPVLESLDYSKRNQHYEQYRYEGPEAD